MKQKQFPHTHVGRWVDSYRTGLMKSGGEMATVTFCKSARISATTYQRFKKVER